MKKKSRISNFSRNLFIASMLLCYLAICVFCVVTTKSWINRRFPGFLVIRHNYVATLYLSDWTGYRSGIRNLDQVLAVNGRQVSTPRELYALAASYEPGTELTYTLRRGNEQVELGIPVSVFTVRDYLLCFPFAMLVGLFFFGSGLVVFYLKPSTPATWYLLTSYVSLAMLYAANGERCTNGVNFIPNIFVPMMGPPLLLFSLHFPVAVRWRRSLTVLVLGAMLLSAGLYVYSFLTNRRFILMDRIYLAFMFFAMVTSVALQLYSYFRSRDLVVRQKAKVAIYGFVLSFIGIFILYFGAIVPKRNNFFFVSIPAAVVPFSLGYAVVKHNLFDVDVFIRRSLSYLIVAGIAVLLFLGLGAALSFLLQDITGQSSRISSVVSTLIIVMAFRPLRTRVDRVIDRRFFRERYEYTATIRKAGAILAGIIDLSELLQKLLDTVMDAIQIERGQILLRDKESGEFRAFTRAGYAAEAAPMALPPGHPLPSRLERSWQPVQINDIEELDDFEPDREELARTMRGQGLALAVPVLYERKLIGIMGLGEKKSGALYAGEDMELLSTLMIQTALSIENARKVEELKKMVELEMSYRDLKRLDEMKDNFLSMVSHDLRTPMTSIKGYASLLHSKAGRVEVERQKHFLEIIIKESDRLTRLINDLLDLQRFEAGRMQLEFEDVDLAEIIKLSADSFRGAALAKRIELSDDLPGPLPVRADADRMAQVMANLLGNAIKFTPEEGAVRVSVEMIEAEEGPMAKVVVADNGPGIAAESLPKLFSRFQQAETRVRTKEQGSGLGLALVRDIVTHHGGDVGVQSEPGQGSKFFFTIKIAGTEDSRNGQKSIDRG